MAIMRGSRHEYRCSFCGKSQDKVQRLIAGPAKPYPVYICDECVGLCVEIIEEEGEAAGKAKRTPTRQEQTQRRRD